jgi:hypothetical protein
LFHAAMHSDARARAELLKSWREVDAVRMARQVERDNEPDYRSILMRKIEEMAARSEASKKGNTDDDGGDEK